MPPYVGRSSGEWAFGLTAMLQAVGLQAVVAGVELPAQALALIARGDEVGSIMADGCQQLCARLEKPFREVKSLLFDRPTDGAIHSRLVHGGSLCLRVASRFAAAV